MRPAIRELVSIIKVGLYGSGMGGWGTTIEGPWNFPLILLIASRRFWPNSINFTAVHRDTLPRFSHVKKIRLVCGPFVFCVIWHMTFLSTRWNHLKQMILESSHWNFSYCSTGSPAVTVVYVDANSLIIHVLQLGWFVGFGAAWCKKISFTTRGVSLLHVKIHWVHLSIPKAQAFGLAWLISQRTLWRINH